MSPKQRNGLHGAWLGALAGLLFFQKLVAQDVSPPQFQPASKATAAFLNVTITSATSGAVIRYTTNGFDPIASDPAYASPATVQIKRPTTLKASAWVGNTASPVAVTTYIVSGG